MFERGREVVGFFVIGEFIFSRRLPRMISGLDVLRPWWHQMKIFSALMVLCVGNPLETVGWIFSLICPWKNGWANNRNAGDLRHHRAHYDVTVMHRIGSITAHPPVTCLSNEAISVTTVQSWLQLQHALKGTSGSAPEAIGGALSTPSVSYTYRLLVSEHWPIPTSSPTRHRRDNGKQWLQWTSLVAWREHFVILQCCNWPRRPAVSRPWRTNQCLISWGTQIHELGNRNRHTRPCSNSLSVKPSIMTPAILKYAQWTALFFTTWRE